MKNMKGISKRERFYSKWEKRRNNKWQYILLYGLGYGAFFGILMFLFKNSFNLQELHLPKLLLLILFFGIVGVAFGYREFKRIDLVYTGLNETIMTGIEQLQSGHVWDYENLKISMDNNDTINVRNEMFWYDKENISAQELNESFNLILADYRGLQKNSDFVEYTKNKKVKIQVFDNSESGLPLIEKMVKG